jgi:hypothetical protein
MVALTSVCRRDEDSFGDEQGSRCSSSLTVVDSGIVYDQMIRSAGERKRRRIARD